MDHGTEEYEFVEGEGIPDCSRIGYTSDGFEIFVGTDDPGRVPHFHYRNTDRSVNTSIRIEKAEYYYFGKFRGILTDTQRKNLQEFMCGKNGRSDMNNWQWIVCEWNQNNSDELKVDVRKTLQPDYIVICIAANADQVCNLEERG